MSLIKCPECGKEISDAAKACIQCGYPIPVLQEEPELKVEHVAFTNQDAEIVKEEHGNEKPALNKNVYSNDIHVSNFWGHPSSKVLLGMIIVALCLSFYSIYMSTKVSNMESKIHEIKSTTDYLDKALYLTNLGIQMTEGVVNDKIVVQKASFYISNIDEISATIDLRPQPSYTYKFLGQGEFDLSDRELRSLVEEAVKAVLDYGKSDFDYLESQYNLLIEKGVIIITANNYNVGEYKDGTVTLTGE